jgi:hypothetical protein
MNEQNEQHEMVCEKTHSSGAEEWYCPTCGRRMLLNCPGPGLVILDLGNVHVWHKGRKNGLPIEPVQATQVEEDEISEESLRPWLKALDEMDLDDLGDEKDA